MKEEFTKRKMVGIKDIILNADNPRQQNEKQAFKAIQSLLVFPKMLFKRPVVLEDETSNKVLGGNMRVRALNWILSATKEQIIYELSKQTKYNKMTAYEQEQLVFYWLEWQKNPLVPVEYADDFTEDEKGEFVLKDNISYGDWDYDILANQFDEVLLDDFGIDVWQNEGGIDVDADDEMIAGEGEKSVDLNYLSFGKNKVAITDEELDGINKIFDEYVASNGTEYGFLNYLLNGDN